MTPLTQLFERQDKELKNKLVSIAEETDNNIWVIELSKAEKLCIETITQSKLEVVKAVMERIEQLKFNFETQDFVEQIENLYDQLQSELNEIEK